MSVHPDRGGCRALRIPPVEARGIHPTTVRAHTVDRDEAQAFTTTATAGCRGRNRVTDVTVGFVANVVLRRRQVTGCVHRRTAAQRACHALRRTVQLRTVHRVGAIRTHRAGRNVLQRRALLAGQRDRCLGCIVVQHRIRIRTAAATRCRSCERVADGTVGFVTDVILRCRHAAIGADFRTAAEHRGNAFQLAHVHCVGVTNAHRNVLQRHRRCRARTAQRHRAAIGRAVFLAVVRQRCDRLVLVLVKQTGFGKVVLQFLDVRRVRRHAAVEIRHRFANVFRRGLAAVQRVRRRRHRTACAHRRITAQRTRHTLRRAIQLRAVQRIRARLGHRAICNVLQRYRRCRARAAQRHRAAMRRAVVTVVSHRRDYLARVLVHQTGIGNIALQFLDVRRNRRHAAVQVRERVASVVRGGFAAIQRVCRCRQLACSIHRRTAAQRACHALRRAVQLRAVHRFHARRVHRAGRNVLQRRALLAGQRDRGLGCIVVQHRIRIRTAAATRCRGCERVADGTVGFVTDVILRCRHTAIGADFRTAAERRGNAFQLAHVHCVGVTNAHRNVLQRDRRRRARTAQRHRAAIGRAVLLSVVRHRCDRLALVLVEQTGFGKVVLQFLHVRRVRRYAAVQVRHRFANVVRSGFAAIQHVRRCRQLAFGVNGRTTAQRACHAL